MPVINKIVFLEKIDSSRKGLFVDRDGVINLKPAEHDYVKLWKEFFFVEGIKELLLTYIHQGYRIIVITNQRGIARGQISQKNFEEISHKMSNCLKEMGVPISAIYYCPHEVEENCSCRKPKPGLILAAVKDFNLDIKNSILIGDSMSDIEAGKAAKVGKLIMLNTNTQSILNTY